MDNKKFRGDRLKVARLYRGKTLTELADMTELSKQAISLYENGTIPDYQRVLTIAHALDFPYDYFLQEDNCQTKTDVTYFRSLVSATKMSRTSQSVKLEFVAKIYEILTQYIDFPRLRLPQIEFFGSDDEFDENAERAMIEEIEVIAQKVREYWNLGSGPIKDLQLALEENGIIVTGFDTSDEKIDAFSQRTIVENADVFFIAVSQGNEPEGRTRFNMAHELGHILLHPWSESLDLITKEEFKLREKQANIFASAFLLPREMFSRDVEAYPTDLKYYQWLKKKWKSSIASMIYRSHQLGLITYNQYQYMMRQYSKNGWRKKEPDDEPFFLNENIFQGAIDLLFEENILTPASLLKVFKNYGVTLYPEEIENLLHLRSGMLKVEEIKPRIIQLKRPQVKGGRNECNES